MKTRSIVVLLTSMLLVVAATRRVASAVQEPAKALHGTVSSFKIGDFSAFVMTPDRNVPVNAPARWVWFFPANFFTAPPPGAGSESAQYANGWLDAGYYLVGIDLGFTGGSPASMKLFDEFYRQIMSRYAFTPRARMFLGSRGGLEAYGFAERYPERVARIGGIYPVSDWRNWPGVDALPLSPPETAFTADDLKNADVLNPIQNLKPMVAAGIEVLTLHGDRDVTVSLDANARAFTDRYRALGGNATMILLPAVGHDVSGIFRQELVDFLLGGK